MKPEFFYNIEIFMVKMLMKLGLCLNGCLDSFEFEKASCLSGYSFHDPCAFRSYYAPLWCDLCNSSTHNVSSCPYYACFAYFDSYLPLTQCMRLELGLVFWVRC